MTYLAVPIAAKDFELAAAQIKVAIKAGAEMLELRTDYLESLSVLLVEKLIAEAKKASKPAVPIIVTCRDKRQGGARDYPVKLRIDVLVGALKAGAEFIDFEYENFLSAANRGVIAAALSRSLNGRLILSAHNFETKFDNITKLHRHIMTLYPAAIAKLVYTANHINDCFEGFDLLRKTGGERIVMCMGQAGLISRIIAKKLGSFVTFASIDNAKATAPGQLTVEQLKGLYRYDSIDSDTELYGVIADPVGHSLSPAVHNACFGGIKANKLYLPFHVQGDKESFDRFMNNVTARKWLGMKGFSVTIPHKKNAIEYVRAKRGFIEPLAEKIGVVNTVLVGANDEMSAYNTDYAGALDAIVSKLRITVDGLKDMPVAVIGAGGVARAIVAGLTNVGARVKIYNRTVEKCQKLAADFDCYFSPLFDLPNLDAKLVVNCTSIGMHPNIDATPLPKQCVKKGMAVFDTVYNPVETLLLKQAAENGAKTIDGMTMFINQALAQFKFFTGQDGNARLMRKRAFGCIAG